MEARARKLEGTPSFRGIRQQRKEKMEKRLRLLKNNFYITLSTHGIILFCPSPVKLFAFLRSTANFFVSSLKRGDKH